MEETTEEKKTRWRLATVQKIRTLMEDEQRLHLQKMEQLNKWLQEQAIED